MSESDEDSTVAIGEERRKRGRLGATQSVRQFSTRDFFKYVDGVGG